MEKIIQSIEYQNPFFWSEKERQAIEAAGTLIMKSIINDYLLKMTETVVIQVCPSHTDTYAEYFWNLKTPTLKITLCPIAKYMENKITVEAADVNYNISVLESCDYAIRPVWIKQTQEKIAQEYPDSPDIWESLYNEYFYSKYDLVLMLIVMWPKIKKELDLTMTNTKTIEEDLKHLIENVQI